MPVLNRNKIKNMINIVEVTNWKIHNDEDNNEKNNQKEIPCLISIENHVNISNPKLIGEKREREEKEYEAYLGSMFKKEKIRI